MSRNLIQLISLLAMVFLPFTEAAASEQITLKFSHVVAENTPKGLMANKFKELVESRLGDRVKVEVFPNSQLFNDDMALEALLLGDIQFAAPTLSKFSHYTRKLQVYDLPFLFRDMAAVERFQKSPTGQQLLKSMEPLGLTGLGYLHNGLKQISADSPLRVPADAMGKKFRIMSSDVLRAQFDALDAISIKKPFSEVFTLLQTKAIDGQENSWSNIYSKKFHEVQPFITESNHGLVDYMVVTSTEFWNGLDNDLRAGLKQAMEDAITYGNQMAEQKSVHDRQAIIDSERSEVLQLSDRERDQWVNVMEPVWHKFESDIGKSVIEAALASNNTP
ncbi:C4-dicarboxylate ABC transporter [Hahella sp. CCB-MM4]|uniref:TRAP transporter substrate-binding protein n=1 Tax=Hahella sp. (strain CCB-MM4) TaxID=1926491 RepID=UPI000B9A8665|nr:TRAP transporter substrate-binding protein [Hahella sp. CCB-MM4]OZG72713.1 C4-dicarboxylate ABC transporter [Hahella sp. CCB-MM4]